MQSSELTNSDLLPGAAYTGVALLGWMQLDQAVRFLMEDCAFPEPMTASAAESLWREWRDRAAALPPREALAPEPIPLTSEENTHAARFLQFLGDIGVGELQVLKVDPMGLVAAQHHIAIDVAQSHVEVCAQDSGWMECMLPTSAGNPQLNMNFVRRNMDTEVVIDLPHAEFVFGVHPHGGFGPKELLSHVMVVRAGNRMVLGKGYHRLYGKVAGTGGSLPERLSLVALDPGMLSPPPRETAADDPGLDIFDARPALFGDFFTEGLAMPVYLRKKRYQLQIHARWVALNEE